MKKVRATTALYNNKFPKDNNRVTVGEVFVIPDSLAKQLMKKGYVELVQESAKAQEKDEPDFTKKKETSETKKEIEESVEEEDDKNFFDQMIPQRFPHFGILKENDVHTFGELREYKDDFSDLHGIGASYAEDIRDAYKDAQQEALKQFQKKAQKE
jgi:hypothetical protein